MIVLALFAILPYALSQGTSPLTNVTNAFTQAKIVPDVLSSFTPTALLNFNFSSKSILPGELLQIPETLTAPTVGLNSNDSALITQTFVVAIVDPDAAANSQVRHFLGGNFILDVSGNSVMTLVNRTPALSEYIHPAPPPGSGAHRYISLVYIQPADFDQTAPLLVNSTVARTHFNISTFAAAVKMGNPVAGNFFLAANNSQVTATGTPSSTTTGTSGSKNSGISTASIRDSFTIRLLLTALLLLAHPMLYY